MKKLLLVLLFVVFAFISFVGISMIHHGLSWDILVGIILAIAGIVCCALTLDNMEVE